MSTPQELSHVARLRRPIAAWAILCPLSLLSVWGCLAELRVYEPAPASRVALRRICCAGMHEVMGKIDKTYRRAHRLPVRQMRDRNFAVMEEHAQRIATHAATIVRSADLSEVNIEDKAVFGQLAERLGSNAKALASASAKKSRVEVRKWFAKVTSTCNACHAAFRGPHNAENDGDS